MQVAGTARITAQYTKEDVGILVRSREVARLASHLHLINLLIVLTSIALVGNLCWQSVVCHALQQIGISVITCNAINLLQRVHHLGSGTKLRAACWVTEVSKLITCPQTCWEAECVRNTTQSLLWSVEMTILLTLLPPDDRLLEALTEVYAVDTVLTIEVIIGCEARCPVSRLLVDNLTQLKQLLVACDVIQPMHNQQVIACTLCSPECPVTQRSLWQLLQLVVEIFCHKINYALIASSHIVLLKNLQRHHTRPPVGSIVTLHTVDVRAVGIRAEIAALLL